MLDDGRKPDGEEKAVRFGCGFLAGVVLGFFGLMDVALFQNHPWGRLLIFAMIFGFLAMRYGDAFWYWLARWWR